MMATSACPITSQLKALTHYHLPFASAEETLFRAVAAYLLNAGFAEVFSLAGGVAAWADQVDPAMPRY